MRKSTADHLLPDIRKRAGNERIVTVRGSMFVARRSSSTLAVRRSWFADAEEVTRHLEGGRSDTDRMKRLVSSVRW
jgi:hypothetical protein